MLDRRHFLIAGGLVPAGFLGLRHLMSDRPLYKDADLVDPGYGPLQRDPRGILDLPEGFRYRIVSWAGPDHVGRPVPARGARRAWPPSRGRTASPW